MFVTFEENWEHTNRLISHLANLFKLFLWYGKLTAGKHQRQVTLDKLHTRPKYQMWMRQMIVVICHFISSAPSPVPRVSVWNRARKQRRRLCETKLPRDARVHATLQRPCNPGWSGISKVSLCTQQHSWSLNQKAQQWDGEGFPTFVVTYPTKQELKEAWRVKKAHNHLEGVVLGEQASIVPTGVFSGEAVLHSDCWCVINHGQCINPGTLLCLGVLHQAVKSIH